LLEEVAQRVHKEEVQEVWEEAEHQAQKEAWKVQEVQEAWEAARHQALKENEMNAHPKEDGDYISDNAMDVDNRTASPEKKKKERVLVGRTGNAWCKGVHVLQGCLLGGRGTGKEVEAAGCGGDSFDVHATWCGVH